MTGFICKLKSAEIFRETPQIDPGLGRSWHFRETPQIDPDLGRSEFTCRHRKRASSNDRIYMQTSRAPASGGVPAGWGLRPQTPPPVSPPSAARPSSTGAA